jgi:high-affinity nickel permease
VFPIFSVGLYFLFKDIFNPTETQSARLGTGFFMGIMASTIIRMAFPKISWEIQVLLQVGEFLGMVISGYFGLIYSVLWFVLVFGLTAGFLGWQRHSQSLSSKEKP